MRELIDCHIHTERCGHATGSAAQMVAAAVVAGLSGILMTEHLPLPDELDPDCHLSMPACDLETYAAEVSALAGRVHGLDVVLAAEADWLPDHPEHASHTRARAAELGIDVLLGSVHFIGGWAFDDPHHIDLWDARDVDAVWEQYFSRWCEAARSGVFTVMAHPDLVKKFGHRPSFDPRELYVEAARAAAEGGVLVEASTAGWRKPVGELYPGPELLSAFAEAGVGMTVGSDAHDPTEVGYRISDALDELAKAGYERYAFPLRADEVRWYEL